MTKLQISIMNLEKAIITAGIVLTELEKALKDSEKPSHVWKHGDVFLNRLGDSMICIREMYTTTKPILQVFCISGFSCDCHHHSDGLLKDGKFLFNIQEKL